MVIKRIRQSPNTEDEESLVLAAQANPEAFKHLYEKYFRKIFLFVLHRVGDKAIAADITSQTFLKALLNLKKYRIRGLPFSAWLYRIALNECLDSFRKSRRHRLVTVDTEGLSHLYEELTDQPALEELERKLPEILEKLSTDELHLIELRFFEQRSFKEVSEIMGITETYAKVRVYRILTKMKKKFQNI